MLHVVPFMCVRVFFVTLKSDFVQFSGLEGFDLSLRVTELFVAWALTCQASASCVTPYLLSSVPHHKHESNNQNTRVTNINIILNPGNTPLYQLLRRN